MLSIYSWGVLALVSNVYHGGDAALLLADACLPFHATVCLVLAMLGISLYLAEHRGVRRQEEGEGEEGEEEGLGVSSTNITDATTRRVWVRSRLHVARVVSTLCTL